MSGQVRATQVTLTAFQSGKCARCGKHGVERTKAFTAPTYADALRHLRELAERPGHAQAMRGNDLMGVDVNLYVEADPNPEALAAAEAFFVARSNIGDTYGGRQVLHYDDADWLPRPRVEVSTMSRYYGPGYERGDWPDIYGAIRVLQAAFPGCKVFYGGDTTDDGVECDDEYLADVWAHFLGPAGDDYRREPGRATTPTPNRPATERA